MLDPMAEAEWLPDVAGRLEGVERLAVRAVADRVHADGPAEPGALAHDLGELLAARDGHAGAVEHPCRLRAERPVHERLEVTDPQVARLRSRSGSRAPRAREAVRRDGLPDAEGEAVARRDPLEDPRRSQPAVLVVDRDDAAAGGDAQPVARRIDELVLGRHRDPSAELPRGLLADDSGRRAGLVALDDAAVHLEVALGPRERCGVEPGGVVVLREEERGCVARDRVERLRRRLFVPVGRPPAIPADPGAVRGCERTRSSASPSRGDAVELRLPAGSATRSGSGRASP